MEDKKLKTLQDFLSEGKTESEYWTYRVIHNEEFRKQEEEEKEQEYPYLILQCLNCGEIIDENITKPDKTLPYEMRVKCKCGKFKFKSISKEKKKELEKGKKEKLSEYRINRIIRRIEIDLEKIKEELDNDLKQGRISEERYLVLMIELILKEYNYYKKDVSKKFDFKSFRDTATSVAKSELEKKYKCEILDEKLDAIVSQYDEERDLIFLEKYEIMLNGASQIEDKQDRLEELNREIKRVEKKRQILLEMEQKDTESKKAIEEKYYSRLQDDKIWSFKQQLKKDLRKS